MFTKIKNYVQDHKASIKAMLIPACIILVLACTMSVVMADEVTPEGILQALLDVIFTIASYIGILLLAWGGVMLILAIRNEDADSKSRAVMLIVVAIALICLGTVFSGVMEAVGYKVSE